MSWLHSMCYWWWLNQFNQMNYYHKLITILLFFQVMCKLCAKHIDKMRGDYRIKGRARSEIDKYAIGTNFVTKYTVTRHLSGTAHRISQELENSLPRTMTSQDSGQPTTSSTSTGVASTSTGVTSSSFRNPSSLGSSQPSIGDALVKAGKDAYRKLLQTAYLLAVDGLPLKSFKTMVKVQKSSGVRLVTGTDSGEKAREFVHFIADAIRQKIAIMVSSSTAISVLTDGSQTRKTGQEKELILVRLVRGGAPIYYVVGMQDLGEYGDPNAENLKMCIDDCFIQKLKIGEENYRNKVVCCTSDGAAVNTGAYNGLLTRMKRDGRPWLVSIHCVSHRAELAIKDSLLKHREFAEVKEFMITLFYFFKNSGKFKAHFKKMADVMGVHAYTIP